MGHPGLLSGKLVKVGSWGHPDLLFKEKLVKSREPMDLHTKSGMWGSQTFSSGKLVKLRGGGRYLGFVSSRFPLKRVGSGRAGLSF
jgi:hypothetical protein